MDHDQLRERLHDFRDGELPGPEAAEVAGHLAACAACRGELAGWERVAALLRVPEPAVGEDFVARVLASLPEEEAEPSPWLAPGFAFALAALLLILAWPGGEALPAAESLLLADAREPAAAETLLQPEAPGPDAVLDLVLEAP